MARGAAFEESIISPANNKMLVALSSNFRLQTADVCVAGKYRILVSATLSLAMKEQLHEPSHHRY